MTSDDQWVNDLLSGRPDAIEKLGQSQDEGWIPLARHLLHRPGPAPQFAASLWKVLPDLKEWHERLKRALRSIDNTISISQRREILFTWLRDSVLSAFSDSHDAAFEMRILDLNTLPRDDGGFRDARHLYEQLVGRGVVGQRLADVALLVAKGAFTERDYEAARRYATSALESFDAANDDKGKNLADRYLAAALVHLRDWGPEHYRAAAELLEREDSSDAASAWASAGDSAATLDDFQQADAAFKRACNLAQGDEARREVDYYLARSLRKRDPVAARTRAHALFRELSTDPELLAESEIGFGTTELLLALLLANKDTEAVTVQQTLVDAKLNLWGECPALWLERHNLGTVWAQLGRLDKARPLIEDALHQLNKALGPDAPNVLLCKRSLARLDSGSGTR
jgi:hypothetical protein